MAEIEKNGQAEGFMSKKYDGIRVTVDNLMTQDRSLENEHEFPNKEVKDVEKLVNEGSKQLNNIDWQYGRREMIEIIVIDLADKWVFLLDYMI